MSANMNPAELRRRGFEILVRELGFIDAVRFLHQYEMGTGDYTRDRDQMLPAMSDVELIREADEMAHRLNARHAPE